MVTRCCNLSPRGDGNISSSDSINVRLLVGCNLSPRGDGNNRGDLSKRQIFPVAIYPREGTETMRTMSSHTLSSVAIYPREGTETSSPSASGGKWGKSLQFIPARGRKQRGDAAGGKRVRCNLSPRGDGNNFKIPHRITVVVAIYPREGTETHPSTSLVLSPSAGCNLSPRGDGNLFTSTRTFNPGLLQFIPVRGRKPFSLMCSPHHASTVAIYPREGTETVTAAS